MLAYRIHTQIFTYVIAALSIEDAAQFAAKNNLLTFSENRVEQWQTPDIWTRRATDAATESGIIDTIPRFVVDRDDGPVYLDIDDIPTKLAFVEVFKCCLDSVMHADWVIACNAEREKSGTLREHIATVALERDPTRYAAMARALAGAWGLGPIPEWHAAILPALIALDIETTDCCNALRNDLFELDIIDLCLELKRCYDASEQAPAWCKEAMRQTLNCLAGQSSTAQIRATSLDVLRLVDWLR